MTISGPRLRRTGFAADTPVPLTDMRAEDAYKGEDGGLYGGGSNEPPPHQLRAALRESASIRPLDPQGKSSPAGLIGLLSVGFSNTWQEFKEFVQLADLDPAKSPALRAVNGAQFHMDSAEWAAGGTAVGPPGHDPWSLLDERLKVAGVTPPQVQVVWLKVAPQEPAALGEFPKHAERTKGDLSMILAALKRRFPNLRIAYLSSRCYGGYARTPLSPEPFAYEGAFAVRWLIQEQIRGDAALNFDPARGAVRAPLLLWGPYLWADGLGGRKFDDLVWARDDFTEEGTHLNPPGARKVARLLLAFMKTDRTARTWFLH